MGLIHEHATDIGPGCELVDVLVVGRVDATGVTFPLVVQYTLYEIQGLIESVPFVESDDRSDFSPEKGNSSPTPSSSTMMKQAPSGASSPGEL